MKIANNNPPIKVSVIIPVYNVERYLTKCLQSIIEQILHEIEIIIINDGSTDSSLKIIESFAIKDHRIISVSQINQGLSASRNAGILLARGDFLAFVDGDDYIDEHMLEDMYLNAINNNAEIVICQFEKVDKFGNVIQKSKIRCDADISFLEKVISLEVPSVVWNKLYKKSFIKNNSLYFENLLHEDILYSLKVFLLMPKISILEKSYYFWLDRDNSISSMVTQEHIKDIFFSIGMNKIELEKINFLDIYFSAFLRRVLLLCNHMLRKIQQDNYLTREVMDRLSKFVFQGFDEYIDYDKFKRSSIFENEIPLLYEYNTFLLHANYISKFHHLIPRNTKFLNYDFSKKMNHVSNFCNLMNRYGYTIAVYGAGEFGKYIYKKLEKSAVLIVDKELSGKSIDGIFISDLKSLVEKKDSYDFILISVLGRESEIGHFLEKTYFIEKSSIIKLDLTCEKLMPNDVIPIRVNERDKLKTLHNKFLNKRCFILGNGPSLNKHDLTLLKNEYTFGVNSIFYKTRDEDFTPTFYMVEDNHVIDDNLDAINNFDCAYKFFPSIYRDKIALSDNTYFFSTDFGFYNPNNPFFCIPRFTYDFSEVSFAGQTVTYMQIQLAFFLGFETVYLIGMDYNYTVPSTTQIINNTFVSFEEDINHFHPDYFGIGKKWHDPKIERVGWNYQKVKEVFSLSQRKIYNATIGGKLEIFDRIEYKSLFGD